MTFDDAKEIQFGFGKFRLFTFDALAKRVDGLKYLLFMHRSLHQGCHPRVLAKRHALDVFLAHPAIAAAVSKLPRSGSARGPGRKAVTYTADQRARNEAMGCGR